MPSRKLLWLLGFLSFIFYAITTNEIGPAIPGIRVEFGLSESIAGALVSLQSLAGVLAILGGVLSDVFGKARILSISLTAMGLGALMVSSSPFAWILGASLFLFGAGTGFFEASVNALISEVFSGRRGMAITLLHIAWNIGSAIGPLLIAFTITAFGSWRLGYLVPFPFLIALSFVTWLISKPLSGRGERTRSEKNQLNLRYVWRIFPLMIMPFLLVASQLGISTWLPSILYDSGATLVEASLTVGLFWALSGVGRLLWAPYIDKFGYWRVLLLTGGFSALLMFVAASPLPIYVKMALWAGSGLLLGPAYPTIVAWVTAAYPEIGGTLSGMVYTFATLGSFTSAVITGILFDLFGSAVAQLIFPSAALSVALVSYAVRGIGKS